MHLTFRPKTTTSWKLMPNRSFISKNWNFYTLGLISKMSLSVITVKPNSRNLLFWPFIYLSLPRFVICQLFVFTSWLHKFANSRFNNQKFVILSIKYECALKKLVKSQSGHTEMITSDLQRVFPNDHSVIIWQVFWFAKLFNDGGLTTIAIWEWLFLI